MKDKTKKTLDWINKHKVALAIGAGTGLVASGALLVCGCKVNPSLFKFMVKHRNDYKTVVVSNNKMYIDDIKDLVNWCSNESTPFAFASGSTKEQIREFFEQLLNESPDDSLFCMMAERIDKK